MTNHPTVIRRFHRDFRRALIRRVHHARADFLALRRTEDETRWGVSQGTPPERPGGRASAELYSLRGFSGRSEENRAGAVVEYFVRFISDIANGSSDETVLRERID